MTARRWGAKGLLALDFYGKCEFFRIAFFNFVVRNKIERNEEAQWDCLIKFSEHIPSVSLRE